MTTPRCWCLTCKNEYSAKGIHTHYIIAHTEEGKKKHKESYAAFLKVGNLGAKAGKDKRERSIKAYNTNPKLCLECNSKISYDKRRSKFCNRSCGATSSMRDRKLNGYKHSDETKALIKKKCKEKDITKRVQAAPYTKIKRCTNCDKYFPDTGRQTCSNECLHLIRSRHGRNNPGLGTKRSVQEIELYNLCLTKFPNAKPNKVIADGWDADIVLEEEKIAILWNGPWHYKQMPFKNHSLLQVQNRDRIKTKLFNKLGWEVLIFEDRYYSPTTAFETIVNNQPAGNRTLVSPL